MRAPMVWAVLGLVLCCSVPAKANEPSPENLMLAQRYVATLELEKSVRVQLDKSVAASSRNAKLSQRQRLAVAEAVQETLSAWTPRLGEEMAIALAMELSLEDLRQIVTFYESPAGRRLKEAMPRAAARMTLAVERYGPQIREDLEARVCRKTGCRSTSPRKDRKVVS